MKGKLLVSVIVTTRNEEDNIENCLSSIKNQSYPNLEIILVDNHSTDRTVEIAKNYTKNIYVLGPERSVQRNYGSSKAKGDYLLFLDADMTLSKDVVNDCVEVIEKDKNIGGVIIPEESYGSSFWAKCKKLEKSFYVHVSWIEAARFFQKNAFIAAGMYQEDMISGEDWDLGQRVRRKYDIGRISSVIYHNEGNLTLSETMGKKYYYAKNISHYMDLHPHSKELKNQKSIVSRYAIFLKDYKKLFKNPILGFGLLFMKTCEFGAGFVGMINKTNR